MRIWRSPSGAAHEFDLICIDHPRYRYAIFYAGYTPEPIYGKPGDRGYLLYSNDLINWEYYPRNPALPALGIGPDQFDSNWVGWPRMYIRDGVGYVFYTGNGEVGLRTIPMVHLTNWETETDPGRLAVMGIFALLYATTWRSCSLACAPCTNATLKIIYHKRLQSVDRART